MKKINGIYIGDLGGMVDCHFLTGMSVSQEDLTIFGGGAGTLSPSYGVSWGVGLREWSCDLSHAEPGQLAALQALVYRQQRYGGAYRMLAVDAQWVNAFTPAASTDFSGWTGAFTVSTLYTAAAEMVGGGTVLYPSTPLEARTPLEGGPPPVQVDSVAAITVTAQSSATLVSPIVPVRPGHVVTLGIFAQGNVTLSARWVDAAGATISTVAQPSVSHSALQRLTPTTQPAPADAAGVRLVVTGGTRYAWPSITWTAGPRRFATGRGADAVHLSPVDESLIMATSERQMSSFQYTIREVA